MSQDGIGASATRLQRTIAGVWQEVLELDELGVDEDFFELGGDSLAAVRMLAAIEELLLAQVSFADFLDSPTVAGVADAVERARRQPEPVDPAPQEDPAGGSPPPGDSAGGPAPLTFAQERLWFVDRLDGATGAYNEVRGARIAGPVDESALERALRNVVGRHAALRTSFAEREGVPVQVVADDLELPLERIDLRGDADPERELERVAEALATKPFELERSPLLRAHLIALPEGEHVLQLVLHHAVSDGWSHVVVLRELGECYRAFANGDEPRLPDPGLQYPDYARRERKRLTGETLDGEVSPWLERLAGAPTALDLPTDRARPAQPSYGGACHVVEVPQPLAVAVRRFAASARATPFATMLAAYYAVLHRYTSQGDIVVGATTSGRTSPDIEDSVGLFAETVALRCELSDEPGFQELVSRVREMVMWAIAHQHAPFEQIVARLGHPRDLSRHPVFQVFCAHVAAVPMPIDDARPFQARPAASRFDLTLFVEEQPDDGLRLAWEYSTDLFDATTIERLSGHYLRLLEAALSDPELSVAALPMTDGPDEDPVAVPEMQGPDVIACVHERFEHWAATTPDAPALAFEDQVLTYGELNRRANRLAHRLRELGAGPETMVALFLAPSIEMLVALLGVLKAGAAYVPIDPEYPTDRIEFVLEDCRAPLIVTASALEGRLPAHVATTITLDAADAELATNSESDPERVAAPENLAYVIYTSGSTGRPKGVMVEHRQVARLFTATDAWYGFRASDVWPLLHSYAFDFSVWEIWGALAYGGKLVISPLWTTRSPEALAQLIADHGVTVMNATPSLFVVVQHELVRLADRLALRFVVFGGEALQPSALRPWYETFGDDGPQLVNMYGITETTVHVTYRPLRSADCELASSPIGEPIPDLTLHLLDAHGAPVPRGVPGELFVGGAGVARGYLNRPELTAERFIENPFGAGRLYRTGDVARRLPDGELDFRGRIDDQVKIRGFRIELGEIHAAIREVGGVADCAVLAVEAAPGDLRLAAYVVPDRGVELDAEADSVVREHLERRLPGYMVPASIVLLDRLPLTRNGKIDRASLPKPVWESEAREAFVAPQTDTERLVAQVWSSVLGLERIGRDDNFFTLGGHSLLAARVATEVRDRTHSKISVRALFELPTLAAFADHVDSSRTPITGEAMPDPGALGAVEGDREPTANPHATGSAEVPASFQQESLLFFDALDPGSSVYNAPLAIRVAGTLDLAALERALRAVIERHEALRTVLVREDDHARQVVLADWSFELELVDLAGLPPADREPELSRQLRDYGARPFDLTRDLLLRATVFRLGPLGHVLLLQSHHIVLDAWAVEILYAELGEGYEAELRGRPARLPEIAMQYGQFARWQRARLAGETLAHELDFWRAQLAGAPAITRLPTDRRRPAEATFEGASHRFRLGAGLADQVSNLCRSEQVTPYMLLLAAFATLLYRRTGQDDIVFGGPMANREEPALKHMLGFCANTVVVRTRLAGNPTFAELLGRVRDSVLSSFEHQEVPLELVVDAVRPQRVPGVNPLFQVNFRVRVGAPPVPVFTGTRTSMVPVDLGHARFELALELHVLEHEIEAELNYNTAVLERETIERLAEDFERVLAQAIADPGARLLSLEFDSETPTAEPLPQAGAIRGFRAGERGEGPRRRAVSGP